MFDSVKGKIKIYSGFFVCYNRIRLENDVPMDLEHSTIKMNGIRLHVVQAGPKSGTPIILLHGSPEFWYR
jgi:hypothetical protein